jgi:UDP-N-acetylmuramyl pentapeptide phosphotransferase/UDP-N-acetylglucosamine-1-phosphate transferase
MLQSIGVSSIYEQLGLLLASAAVLSAALIAGLFPLLTRYALARPNARSSHHTPTPQGGGIAVIGATTLVLIIAAILKLSTFDEPFQLTFVFASAIGIAAVGVTDDIRPIEALPRLLLQALAVTVALAALPLDFHIFPILPWVAERALFFVGMIWFVNLVNFMDGIDLMTVVEVVPMTASLALFGIMGALPHDATLVAVALCGAIIGFAPFNRPVARLFLGDVGSLPIGLLLGWLLVSLAGTGHIAASLMLPLYFVADATITLLGRLSNREKILQAHRSHFYQRAKDGGFSVYQIVGRVFGLNIILAGLATLTTMSASIALQAIALAIGILLVGLLLWNFSHAYRR